MHIPAFCDSCGTAFRSGLEMESVKNVSLVGNRAGPCPVCGGMGHVPDGVFSVLGDTIEVLIAPQRTIDELTRLSAMLRKAQEQREEPEQVAQAIREELPELTKLADFLPKTRVELYALLTLVLTAITFLLQASESNISKQNLTVNQTINLALAKTEECVNSKDAPRQSVKRATPKVGRNDPCPCGRGKKYKKCCANPLKR